MFNSNEVQLDNHSNYHPLTKRGKDDVGATIEKGSTRDEPTLTIITMVEEGSLSELAPTKTLRPL